MAKRDRFDDMELVIREMLIKQQEHGGLLHQHSAVLEEQRQLFAKQVEITSSLVENSHQTTESIGKLLEIFRSFKGTLQHHETGLRRLEGREDDDE